MLSFITRFNISACKHWIIDGLCQLLLNCSFEDWINQNSQNSSSLMIINPPGLDSGEIRWVGRELIIQTLKNKLIDITKDWEHLTFAMSINT
jgi:hypothetical protein